MQIDNCAWPLKDKLEQDYHDKEWGRPVFDDQKLFEQLCLEGAQAGLSWRTILKKREGYRDAFQKFDIEKLITVELGCAEQLDKQVAEIIEKFDVVKHKGKIASVYINAVAAKKLQQEFGSLSKALWQFVDEKPRQNKRKHRGEIPATTPESIEMSKFLKKKGFKFVGPTICYAFMQATGMVNDHLVVCPCYGEVK